MEEIKNHLAAADAQLATIANAANKGPQHLAAIEMLAALKKLVALIEAQPVSGATA